MKIASITTLLLTIFSLAFVWSAWSKSYDAGKRIFDAHAAANMEEIRWGLKDLYIWQGLIGTGLIISISLSLSSLVLTIIALRKTEQDAPSNR